MSPLTSQEREVAERRIEEIRDQIKALHASGNAASRTAEWETLLTESLQLQEKLDRDEASNSSP
jgi:hypothetical protein